MKQKNFIWLGMAVAAGLLLTTFVLAETIFAAEGSGPADAIIITGETATAQPNSHTWYKFQEAGNSQLVTAALNSNNPDGMSFNVYTPEGIANWIAQRGLHPIGVSSQSPGAAQAWQGRFQGAGTYYLVVTNSNTYPVEYQLTVRGDGVTTIVNIPPTQTALPNPFETRVPVGALNGGTIVFQEASGGQIYRVDADGKNLQPLTFGLDPAFSPDGSKIAFARQGADAGLYVMNADGTGARNLFGANEVRSPTWASDSEIVFSTVNKEVAGTPICFLGRCFDTGDVTRWKLLVYNLNDDTLKSVETPRTGGTVPSANRVNENIAFMSPELGLMLTALNDMTPQIIDNDLSINTPNVSPDGSRLTYMVAQPPAHQVVVSVWDGTNPTLLTKNDPLAFEHPDNVAPTFSPNSQEILFLSNRNGRWEFFAINADGTNLRQVLKNVTDQLNLQYNYSAERVASWTK